MRELIRRVHDRESLLDLLRAIEWPLDPDEPFEELPTHRRSPAHKLCRLLRHVPPDTQDARRIFLAEFDRTLVRSDVHGIARELRASGQLQGLEQAIILMTGGDYHDIGFALLERDKGQIPAFHWRRGKVPPWIEERLRILNWANSDQWGQAWSDVSLEGRVTGSQVVLSRNDLTIRDGVMVHVLVRLNDLQDIGGVEVDRRSIREIDGSEGVAVRLGSATKRPSSSSRLVGTPLLKKGHFAKLEPSGPIRFRIGSNARPRLEDNQSIWIPDLKEEAQSYGRACTRLSEAFELLRNAHTYSAFEVVFVRRGKEWLPLRELAR